MATNQAAARAYNGHWIRHRRPTMTPTEALTAIRDLANAALGGVVVAPPVPDPVPFAVDSDGCAALRVVEAYVAANGPAVPIPGAMPGEPNVAPVVIPRKFQTPETLVTLRGDALEKAWLSVKGAELRQNRVATYGPAPWWKPSLKWVETGSVPGALSSSRGAAWLGQAVVGRARLIAQGRASATFLWLTEADYAAGV